MRFKADDAAAFGMRLRSFRLCLVVVLPDAWQVVLEDAHKGHDEDPGEIPRNSRSSPRTSPTISAEARRRGMSAVVNVVPCRASSMADMV